MKLTAEQLNDYDTIIVAFSGGKDSVACVLDLLEAGAEKERIELWHHDIDGNESDRFMDWAVTKDYCRAFAEAMDLKLYYSWKVGGFSREMLRNESKTAPIKFETPDGEIKQVGGTRGKNGTRRKFPQVSADLSVRWCSAYLKVDVCSTAIRNQERFNNHKTLLVSGERAQESPGRAKYAEFEPDRADNRGGARVDRHVDRYRPVHKWLEEDVWAIIERWNIRVHPAYYIGWGRVSCAACIFGSAHQWATLNLIDPDQVEKIAGYEDEFGVTIRRDKTVRQMVAEGTPYDVDEQLSHVMDSLEEKYDHEIFIPEGEWTLPAGAYGESCGPV
jgi:3'-phosphoadenosine 5'-phosphosulfate sulfotransferase (PAPS reductase)/FAD synthetase